MLFVHKFWNNWSNQFLPAHVLQINMDSAMLLLRMNNFLKNLTNILCSWLSRTPNSAFTPCYHLAKTVTDPSVQGVITTIYQWLPEHYIINRLFSVLFSNMYDDSVLVLGIVSVLYVLKFHFLFLLFLFMCRSLFSTAFWNCSYAFVVLFYNEWMNEWIGLEGNERVGIISVQVVIEWQ